MSELMQKRMLFPVSAEREAYNTIRVKYQSLAQKAQDDFSERYDTLFKNIEDIHNKCDDVAMGYLGKVIDEAIRDLIKYGISDIDENEFYNNYIVDFKNNPWAEGFAEIDDKYLEIVMEAEALDEYRDARAENRGRWVGGGFGVGGAIKGAAGAAAANLAMGAVHGAFNLAAKGITAIGNSFKKSALFSDTDTAASLEVSIYYMIEAVHDALVDAINDKKPETITGFRKKAEAEKAERTFGNINAGRIEGDDAKASLIECLTLDPYVAKYYDYWLKQYGDANGQLELTAQHFGLTNITETKTKLIEDKQSKLDFKTPEACMSNLKELESYAATIGYIAMDTKKAEITTLAEKLDRERRTFNGKTYESIETMKSAKAEFDELQSRTVDGTVYENIELAKSAKNKFDDKQARTVNGVTHDTVEKAEIERSKKKVGIFLGIAIAIVPYIFGFLTLRKGYSMRARIITFVWMAITIGILVSNK